MCVCVCVYRLSHVLSWFNYALLFSFLKVREGYDSTLCCGDGGHQELPLILVDRGAEGMKVHRYDTTRMVHTVQLEVSHV